MAGLVPAIHVDPRAKPGDDDLRESTNLIVPHIDRPTFLSQFSVPLLAPVIGHRGAAGHAPENTLISLRRAKELGCSWVEFDVRLTADGVPVLCHDSRLDRTTDGKGLVSGQTVAAIQKHDAGSWFDPAFANERVPTLEEALLVAAELDLGTNIELKADRGQQYQIGAAVAATLDRLQGRIPAVLVSSFHPIGLNAVDKLVPHLPRGILFRVIPRNWSDIASRFQCGVIGADHRRLRPRRTAEIRGAGYQLAAYTVNDPQRAQALFSWGVTSVFTDVPDIILLVSRRQPPVWHSAAGAPFSVETRQGAMQ
jgi:glycerophosphoryl diester phosphodiesterase